MSEQPRGRGRGRGRGYQGSQNNQQHSFNDDQVMYDANAPHGRGRARGASRGPPRGPRGGRNNFQPNHSRHGEQLDPEEKAKLESNPAFQLMKDFLGRRYDATTKLLNLSTIANDQEILQSGMFATEGAQKKFFPALMKVCDSMLETPEAKEAAIDSVTLSGNNLQNTHVVYTLVHSLRHIKNLDLSNNAFTIQSLQPWKGRFRNLEHLIVDPMSTPGWEEELTSWFPKLKILNDKQVRPGNTNNNTNTTSTTMNTTPTPNTPAVGTPVPDLEQQRKEEMILYVQQQTNLKRDYAIQCLEAANWNIEQAGVLFQQSQATLPAEAYN